MNVENFRSLIAALPTVMSLGLLAILAFPTTKTGLKNEKYYKIFSSILFPIIGLFVVSILLDINSLAVLSEKGNNPLLYWAIPLSILSLIIMPTYLFVYVVIVPKICK